MEKFIICKDPSETITMNDRLKIKECFFRFKHMYQNLSKRLDKGKGAPLTDIKNSKNTPSASNNNNMSSSEALKYQESIKRLKLLIS